MSTRSRAAVHVLTAQHTLRADIERSRPLHLRDDPDERCDQRDRLAMRRDLLHGLWAEFRATKTAPVTAAT